MEIVESLIKSGFSSSEAKVYLAILALGEATVLPIAKKSGLQRTYCYDVLEKLNEKGFVYYVERRGRRRYVAAQPKIVKKVLLNKINSLDSVLPDLEILYQQVPSRPRVRYFDGKEGLEAVHDETLAEASEVLVLGSGEDWLRLFPDYQDFIKQLVKANIIIKDLIERTPETLGYQKLYRPPQQEMRFIKENWDLPADCAIWGNKVAWLSYASDDLHAVLIESAQIAQAMKTTFSILWEQSGAN